MTRLDVHAGAPPARHSGICFACDGCGSERGTHRLGKTASPVGTGLWQVPRTPLVSLSPCLPFPVDVTTTSKEFESPCPRGQQGLCLLPPCSGFQEKEPNRPRPWGGRGAVTVAWHHQLGTLEGHQCVAHAEEGRPWPAAGVDNLLYIEHKANAVRPCTCPHHLQAAKPHSRTAITVGGLLPRPPELGPQEVATCRAECSGPRSRPSLKSRGRVTCHLFRHSSARPLPPEGAPQ